MSAIEVRDSLSYGPEHIVEAAKSIGRSERKRKVFEAVYHHKKRFKSLTDIVDLSGLEKQQIRQAGVQLLNSGIVKQEKRNGEVAYGQIPFFQHNKAKILALVNNPSRIRDVPTIRAQAISFVRNRGTVNGAKQRHGKKAKSPRRASRPLRVAFLTTNPDPREILRTDIEARNVLQAIKKSAFRDLVDVRPLPAARPSDLIDALNDFRPNVVHFSGHGGDQSLLFDDDTLDGQGGLDIDFNLVNDIIAATDNPPDVLIFNACDTLDGAEIFLENVSVVIAMSSSILDVSASVFSAQFYAAIASRQSIASALKQGKVAIKTANLGDADIPSYLHRENVDVSQFILLK